MSTKVLDSTLICTIYINRTHTHNQSLSLLFPLACSCIYIRRFVPIYNEAIYMSQPMTYVHIYTYTLKYSYVKFTPNYYDSFFRTSCF